MVAVPVPYVAVAGAKAAASAFNAGVGSVLDYLMGTGGNGYPRAHIYSSTGLVFTNGVNRIINFDNETFDNDSMHDTVTNNSRITFTTAGLYDVDFLFTLPSATYTALDLNVRLNSAGSAAGGTSLRTQPFDTAGAGLTPFRFWRFFNAGDHIEFFLSQTSGANRTSSATSLASRAFVRWMASS